MPVTKVQPAPQLGQRLRSEHGCSCPRDSAVLVRSALNQDGLEIRKAILSQDQIDWIKSDIDLDSVKLRRHGVRNLEQRFDSLASVAGSGALLSIVESLLSEPVRLVRALFFHKTLTRNWSVAWHQDRLVTLNPRMDRDGWGSWSTDDGVHHVQPPVHVLDKMIIVRLRIDPADERNGCLRVIPGSHGYGVLQRSEIERIINRSAALACVADEGDALLMRPLLLHASDKTVRRVHRRVVHLEYSSYKLPNGVRWA